MAVVLWIIIAVLAAFGFVYLAARRARARRPPLVLPPGESLPATPLERLAQRTLAVCVLLALAGIALVAHYGPQVYWDDDRVRLSVMGLILAMLAAFAFLGMRTAAWAVKGEDALDERDRAILAGATAGQAGAMLVTLAAWQIGLAETFHAAGQVPMVYLYLMFWSCLVMSQLSWVAGIVVGYRQR